MQDIKFFVCSNYLIFTTTISGSYYYPHFTGEESEVKLLP